MVKVTDERLGQLSESQISQPILKKGIQKGIKKGIEEGEARKSQAIAQNLLSMGLPIAQIMQATGLTQEQIESLKH